jgi:predicted aldo/keto reductase-like oxidoreductase
VRNQVIAATKTEAGASDTRRDMMKALEGSLRRLRTGRTDVYFNHAVDDVARMQNPEWREFTDLAKRRGKIRFRGMSGHGEELVKCIDYAVDNDLVDVVLAAYSFAQDPKFADRLRHTVHWAAIQPKIPRALQKAEQKDVGVLAMKTLMGGRMNDLRPFERPGGTFSQAALRWVLSTPHVDALLISMTAREEIDEFLGASGSTKLSSRDLDLLAAYAEARVGNYCLPGCAACAESRPVPIAEVLRTRVYAVDYRDMILARDEYAMLAVKAGACLSCSGQPLPRRLPGESAHRNLHAAGGREPRLSHHWHARVPRPLRARCMDAADQVPVPRGVVSGPWRAAARARDVGLLVGCAPLAGLGAAAPPLLPRGLRLDRGAHRDRHRGHQGRAVPARSRVDDLAHELVREQGVRAGGLRDDGGLAGARPPGAAGRASRVGALRRPRRPANGAASAPDSGTGARLGLACLP